MLAIFVEQFFIYSVDRETIINGSIGALDVAFLCVLQLVSVGSAHLLAASVGRVQAAGVASYASQYVIVTCRRGARAWLRS